MHWAHTWDSSLMDGAFDVLADYDLVVLECMPGPSNHATPVLIASLLQEVKAGKICYAICAAPIVLERAGLLEGRKS